MRCVIEPTPRSRKWQMPILFQSSTSKTILRISLQLTRCLARSTATWQLSSRYSSTYLVEAWWRCIQNATCPSWKKFHLSRTWVASVSLSSAMAIMHLRWRQQQSMIQLNKNLWLILQLLWVKNSGSQMVHAMRTTLLCLLKPLLLTKTRVSTPSLSESVTTKCAPALVSWSRTWAGRLVWMA